MNGREVLGTFTRSTGIIEVSSSQPAEFMRETLAHEVAHAVLQSNGMCNLFNEQQTEAICDFAAIVSETMRKYDNE